ncbi:MAG: VTT domain-containing protein [Mangrovibacterium sp.]|nr:VTT domain-containing protein [Mangrovibacterium sp.]
MIEMLLHVDRYLQEIVNAYATLTYVILFFIIFLETGVVVTPFLPGDSLLFAAGALAATGSFHLWILFLVVFVAAVLGDTVNYHAGKFIGPKVFNRESSLLFRKEYLIRAQDFYEKHGKATIIIARFIPIIRTFAPFVAGIGKMRYMVFLSYNVIGGCVWCMVFIFGGFLFGNIPWIKGHFSLIALIIIFVSILPILKEAVTFLLAKIRKK